MPFRKRLTAGVPEIYETLACLPEVTAQDFRQKIVILPQPFGEIPASPARLPAGFACDFAQGQDDVFVSQVRVITSIGASFPG